jgi:hypothetical protein
MLKFALVAFAAVAATVLVMNIVGSKAAAKDHRPEDRALGSAEEIAPEQPGSISEGPLRGPAPVVEATRAVSPPSSAAAGEAPRRLAGDPHAEPSGPSPEDLRDFMHVEMTKQAVDPGATKSLREKVSDLLAKNRMAGSDVRSIVCGEAMCEMEIVHADAGAYATFMGHLSPHEFEWPGERFATPAGDADGHGAIAMKVFLARAGKSLPMLD